MDSRKLKTVSDRKLCLRDRRRRDAGQAGSYSVGLAARPPKRSDVVHNAKCEHAVDVITAAYWQFTLPGATQTRPSCRVWRAV